MAATMTHSAPASLLTVRMSIADAATNTYVLTTTRGLCVIDAIVHKTGGAGGVGDTVTITNAGVAITDAIVTNDADTTISRAGTINDATQVVALGGTLITAVNNGGLGNAAVDVYIYAIPA